MALAPDTDGRVTAVIVGRVVRWGGAPVAGADVVLESPEPYRSSLGPLASTRTDGRGHFALATSYAGPFRVTATERVADRVIAQTARDDVFPGRRELEIVLHPALVQGWVVDDLGRPVTDFRIDWTPLEKDLAVSPGKAGERFQSTSGAFTATLSPGMWRASVKGSGDFWPAQLDVGVPPVEPMTILLHRHGIVRGTVVDEAGKPVAGARIVAPEAAREGCFSRKDGSFLLKVLPDTPFSLWAEGLLRAPSAIQSLLLAPGEERELVLRLNRVGRITGEVVDPWGRPASGRKITFAQDGISGVWIAGQQPHGVETDGQGHFEAEVTPGIYFLSVTLGEAELDSLGRSAADDPTKCVRRVKVGPGEAVPVRMAIGGTPVRLWGRIEVGGEVATLRQVFAKGYGGGRSWYASLDGGCYEVLAPEPGPYTLGISVEGLHLQQCVDVPDSEEYRFDVHIALGQIAGSVRDELGNPLKGITIDAMSHGVTQSSRSSVRAKTDKTGAYSIKLTPGIYRILALTALEEARSFIEPEPFITEVEPNTDRHGIDFVLQTTGAIQGVVRRADGGTLRGALVHVRRHTDFTSEWSRSTDDAGSFHIPLKGGSYWIRAMGSDGDVDYALAEPLRVDLQTGAVQMLDLRLVAGTLVTVRVLDAQCHIAWPWAEIEALDQRGRSFPADTRDPDVYVLWLAPPGPYTLRARHEYRIFERALVLPPGDPRMHLEFRME